MIAFITTFTPAGPRRRAARLAAQHLGPAAFEVPITHAAFASARANRRGCPGRSRPIRSAGKARALVILLAGLICAVAHRAPAQWMQQPVTLNPGWNAVFLEVDPTPRDCDALFSGLPIESVWDWNPAADPAQFVQDPGTLIPGAPGWLTWFPPNHPLVGQGNLFALRDGRPYLIKSTNAQPVTWTVTGRPSLRRLTWRPGTANLVGFHVGATAPTFQNLFAGQSGLTGQPVYALDAGGVWRALTDLSTARPKAGEAYWVRCKQPSQAAGTTLVETGSRLGLDFGAIAGEQSIRIRNVSAGVRTLSVRALASATPPPGQTSPAGPVPLEYWRASYSTTNFSWEPVTGPISFAGLPAGQEWNLRLGVRRPATATPGSSYQSLLEVTDDLGTRWLIPVSAHAGPTPSGSGFQAASEPTASPHAGLWIGDAVLNAVSQPAHLGDSALPRPAGGTFPFRLLVHVAADGSARLLQKVFLVRKPPVLGPDVEDPSTDRIIEPARTVAVTDEALIPDIIGTGPIIGRRVNSAAFSFHQPVDLAGSGFGLGTLQGTFLLDYDDPQNPFKHAFHPDHNNLDERFEQKLPEGRESFTVSRSVSMLFTALDPLGLNPPGWGTSELGGLYRETITGLHRKPIVVSGSFRLVRVLSTASLNE